MPPGTPTDPIGAQQPNLLRELSRAYDNPVSQWEALKVLRGLAWKQSGGDLRAADLPPTAASLVGRPRLSQAAVVLGHRLKAKDKKHLDDDWFSTNPSLWRFVKGTAQATVTPPPAWEGIVTRTLCAALENALDVDALTSPGPPSSWADRNCPPLKAVPAGGVKHLAAFDDTFGLRGVSRPASRPIDFWWFATQATATWSIRVLDGADRVAVLFETPPMIAIHATANPAPDP